MHIAFVGMSGVRIYDPELTALGMTLPGFIERGKVIASLPCLGLLTLAGSTPEHIGTSYHEADSYSFEVVDAILKLKPDLVAISSLTAKIDEAYLLADSLRSAGVKVVIGGLHATALPSEAAEHADSVVIGEGDLVWQELLDDLTNCNLKPLYSSFGRTQTPWSHHAQVPRYSLLDPEKYNRFTLQTTRGCPLDCEFCAASRMLGPYRRKPIDLIERELDAIFEVTPKPFIELADDNTFVNKKWGLELVKVLGKRSIRWFTETDVSLADDPALMDSLRDSGCAQVLIGFESVSTESLKQSDSKGWKARRRAKYLEAIERIQSFGISVNGCFVMGFDDDGPEVFEATASFVKESGLTEVQVTILTPFPGTRLYDRLSREGRLLKEKFWNQCTLFDTTYRPANMSVDELRTGFRDLVKSLYSEQESAIRRAARLRMLRHAKS